MRRRRIQFDTEIEMSVEAVESSSDPVILEIEVGAGKILLDICRSFHSVKRVVASSRKAEIPSD